MSLGVVIKGPEGVVLAADSRVTLNAQQQGSPPFTVNFDNATKLLSFESPHNHVGAVTYGAATIGIRTAQSFVPEFELTLKEDQRLSVEEFAKRLSSFFMERWREGGNNAPPESNQAPGMTFAVGGYDPDAAYGKVFLFQVPGQPDPQPRNPGEGEFGMTWGGQLEIASRMIHGYDPALINVLRETLDLDDEKVSQITQALRSRLEFRVPYASLPLQDCVNLATFMIRSTAILQGLAGWPKGGGWPHRRCGYYANQWP